MTVRQFKSAAKQPLRALLIAAGVFGVAATAPASATPFDDWLAGAIPAMQKKITYSGDPIELKFHHPAPPASIIPPMWQKTFDWLETATNGKLKVKVFGAQTLVGIKDGFKGVAAGISDFGTCYTIFEPRGFEMSKVFSQAFVSSGNPLKDSRMFYELFETYLKPEWDRRKVAYGSTAPIGVTDIMSVEPIRKLSDLKGKKVIWQGGPPEAAKALGFVTLNVPFPEIYTSFQQGIADAVIWTDAGFVPFKVYEIGKNHTTLKINGGGIDLCFNPKMYADLPEDLRSVFLALQQPLGAYVAEQSGISFHEKALGIYKQNGVNFLQLDPGERDKMVAASQPVLTAWAEAREKDGKPGKALLAAIEKLKVKYANTSDEEMMRIVLNDPVPKLVN